MTNLGPHLPPTPPRKQGGPPIQSPGVATRVGGERERLCRHERGRNVTRGCPRRGTVDRNPSCPAETPRSLSRRAWTEPCAGASGTWRPEINRIPGLELILLPHSEPPILLTGLLSGGSRWPPPPWGPGDAGGGGVTWRNHVVEDFLKGTAPLGTAAPPFPPCLPAFVPQHLHPPTPASHCSPLPSSPFPSVPSPFPPLSSPLFPRPPSSPLSSPPLLPLPSPP